MYHISLQFDPFIYQFSSAYPVEGQLPVEYPSYHEARGEVHPGNVTNLSQLTRYRDRQPFTFTAMAVNRH